MPEFITVEEAIFQLVEVLENTAPEARPPFADVVAAVAWGYGPGEVVVWPPSSGFNSEED